jgi:hypothetical protein
MLMEQIRKYNEQPTGVPDEKKIRMVLKLGPRNLNGLSEHRESF